MKDGGEEMKGKGGKTAWEMSTAPRKESSRGKVQRIETRKAGNTSLCSEGAFATATLTMMSGVNVIEVPSREG